MSRGVQRCRLDANHGDVAKALLSIGCSVQSLAAVGLGCPDLISAKDGVNVLFEVKDGSKPPSERKLTKDERAFSGRWKGPLFTVESAEEAVLLMNEAVKLPARLRRDLYKGVGESE